MIVEKNTQGSQAALTADLTYIYICTGRVSRRRRLSHGAMLVYSHRCFYCVDVRDACTDDECSGTMSDEARPVLDLLRLMEGRTAHSAWPSNALAQLAVHVLQSRNGVMLCLPNSTAHHGHVMGAASSPRAAFLASGS